MKRQFLGTLDTNKKLNVREVDEPRLCGDSPVPAGTHRSPPPSIPSVESTETAPAEPWPLVSSASAPRVGAKTGAPDTRGDVYEWQCWLRPAVGAPALCSIWIKAMPVSGWLHFHRDSISNQFKQGTKQSTEGTGYNSRKEEAATGARQSLEEYRELDQE